MSFTEQRGDTGRRFEGEIERDGHVDGSWNKMTALYSKYMEHYVVLEMDIRRSAI